MLLSRIYWTLLGIAITSFVAIGQVEINDTSAVEFEKDDLYNIVDLPASYEQSEEILREGEMVQTFEDYLKREIDGFNVYDYLKTLSGSLYPLNPQVHIGDIKFLLNDYSKYPKNRIQLVRSSEFIYNAENQIIEIIIKAEELD